MTVERCAPAAPLPSETLDRLVDAVRVYHVGDVDQSTMVIYFQKYTYGDENYFRLRQ